MHVAELWRFPVKSMAGEALGRADIRPDGIAGDRAVYVRGAHGRVVTARTRPRCSWQDSNLRPVDTERTSPRARGQKSKGLTRCGLLRSAPD